MNLYPLLCARREPIRVLVVGCGKFATMFLAQAKHMANIHVAAIAELNVDRARSNLVKAGWPADRLAATDLDRALDDGTTLIGDDALNLIDAGRFDVVVEATGDPAAGYRHADRALDAGAHVIMVNVETDVCVGPVLAAKAEAKDRVYAFAYGDQPALIAELVDWARVCGFEVAAAGKGTRYLPAFHRSTPETVWDNLGFSKAFAENAGMNPKMFNSFVDGTKSAIEMAAVANATGLQPQIKGLGFPPCGSDDLPLILRPETDGGVLEHKGTVEVVADLERDGRPVTNHLRWGVYVTFEAPSDYAAACFKEYGLLPKGEHGLINGPDRYAALCRPFHLIGLELGVSVAQAALKQTATGCTRGFSADVVATAKRPLEAGEVLDGEGGYLVYGRLTTAADSLAKRALPLGLAKDVTLVRPIARDAIITRDDVRLDPNEPLVAARAAMEKRFSK
ncbi:MAG: NAD(P)H-dependent oxidoreductase [Geminicoccaceae bacterium]